MKNNSKTNAPKLCLTLQKRNLMRHLINQYKAGALNVGK